MQILTNILERLNSNQETTANFSGGNQDSKIADRNANLAPLFLTAELGNADAHTGGSVSETLTRLGFDMSQTNSGYGTALDFVFDQNVAAFIYIGDEIKAIQARSFYVRRRSHNLAEVGNRSNAREWQLCLAATQHVVVGSSGNYGPKIAENYFFILAVRPI